jgi:hypothetical protein
MYLRSNTKIQVNSFFLRLNESGLPIPEGHLRLKDYYFNPTAVDQGYFDACESPNNTNVCVLGIDPIIRGMAAQAQKEVDTAFVEGKLLQNESVYICVNSKCVSVGTCVSSEC